LPHQRRKQRPVLSLYCLFDLKRPDAYNRYGGCQHQSAGPAFLPYQVVENNKLYNGWIELTVNTAGEKVVVHKAAISKEPDKIVKAGE